LISGFSENRPSFLLDGDILELDTIRFQYSTSAVFSGPSEVTDTIDSIKNATHSAKFSTGALADGTWYFRARIERPTRAPSDWSNIETETIATKGLNAPPSVPHNQGSGPESTDPRVLHAEMLRRIASLEEALRKLSPRHRGIGDNNPPEPIGPEGLGNADRRAVLDAIAVLKVQPPEPTETPTKALEAAKLLRKIARRLRIAASSAGKYVGRQADTFVSEAAKSAGSELGKRAIQSPFWWVVIDRMCAVADAATHWIKSLGLPL